VATDIESKTRPKFEATLTALLSHPTRAAAFVILVEREACPQDIAHELRKDVGHVGYHVRKLHEMGHIELVREKPVRGAVAHYYKAVKRPFSDTQAWTEMTDEQRGALTRLTLQLVTTDAAQAVDAGTFDSRMDRCLVRVPIGEIDDEGFRELHDLHEKLYEDTLEVMGRSQNRIADDPERASFPAASAAMFFERPVRDGGKRTPR
jgi:DNA-binding transcriptional ArsR family regulator